ncbi:MAG: hypothetical protein RLZZ413_2863 [Pseudomonadota bacterium]
MNNVYRLASGLIIAGFFMLCQPFAKVLFEWGFPVLLAGVFLFRMRRFRPIDFAVAARPSTDPTMRRELVGESRTRSW